MMFRAVAGCTALVLGLLLSLNASAAPACEGAGCATAKAKPLDIMQFMREQAASTRVAKPRHGHARVTAKVKRAPHRMIAAWRKPVRMPVEAAASFASRPELKEQAKAPVVTPDEHNASDHTADTAPSETTGAAVATGPDVQLVDAEQLNDIDRKADVGPTSANPERSDAPTNSEQANASWVQWLWSALGITFAALATAVHQLVRT
jgi:hypothetical protein